MSADELAILKAAGVILYAVGFVFMIMGLLIGAIKC